MEQTKIEAFLREKRIAILATIGKDGSPHLTSMWYRYDGVAITFWAGWSVLKVKNIQRDARVSILVDEGREPYKGVRIDGIATLDESNVREQAYAIARRYWGHQRGTKYVDEYGDEMGVIIRVTPRRIYSWDDSKL